MRLDAQSILKRHHRTLQEQCKLWTVSRVLNIFTKISQKFLVFWVEKIHVSPKSLQFRMKMSFEIELKGYSWQGRNVETHEVCWCHPQELLWQLLLDLLDVLHCVLQSSPLPASLQLRLPAILWTPAEVDHLISVACYSRSIQSFEQQTCNASQRGGSPNSYLQKKPVCLLFLWILKPCRANLLLPLPCSCQQCSHYTSKHRYLDINDA